MSTKSLPDEEIFAEALKLPAGPDREKFLQDKCSSPEQLKLVQDLLNAHDIEHGILDASPAKIQSGNNAKDLTGSMGVQAQLPFLKPCENADRIGKLGKYEVIQEIGRGGMGIVLLAFDPALDINVAIKVMKPEFANQPMAARKFLEEARHAAKVQHENVAKVLAVDATNDPPFLVMEFVEGETLRDLIDREGALKLDDILDMGQQMASALAAAHDKGVIHCDIKPGNVLLRNHIKQVKITDFGLAHAAHHLHPHGLIAGTPEYMSPEQAAGKSIDYRSDLFSLGSVLYEMCTGQRAFYADNWHDAIKRVQSHTPESMRVLKPGIPKGLGDIVDKLHQKNPFDRYPSARNVEEELNRLRDPPPPPSTPPIPNFFVIAIVLVLALVAVVGVWRSGFFRLSSRKPSLEIKWADVTARTVNVGWRDVPVSDKEILWLWFGNKNTAFPQNRIVDPESPKSGLVIGPVSSDTTTAWIAPGPSNINVQKVKDNIEDAPSPSDLNSIASSVFPLLPVSAKGD